MTESKRLVIQVDRVASLAEAMRFRDAGADLIGVALEADPRFADDRFVAAEVASSIRDAVGADRTVAILPDTFSYDDLDARLDRLLALRPGMVQVTRSGLPGGYEEAAWDEGARVLVDGVDMGDTYGSVVEDGDPASYLRDRLRSIEAYRPPFIHVDVAYPNPDPWRFLTEVAPRFPDECLQVAHVAAATREFPLLLNLAGLTPDTVVPFVRAFPDARGFFGRLGPPKGGGATSSPEDLLAVLRVLPQ